MRDFGFWTILILAGALFGLTPTPVSAQDQGQQGQQGQNGQNGAGGILIDAKGVVTPLFTKKNSKALQKQREAAAEKNLSADVNQSSPMRMISLVRLEKAYSELLEQNKPIPPEMQFLAGIQRIEYVFVYPDDGDIVIAGPAEGFARDDVGRMVGLTNNRPPLRLDDLIVAFRSARGGNVIGCSIDPQEQNLAQLQQYLAANSTPASVAVAKSRYAVMAKVLGLQNVRTWGVPDDSNFAMTLVEADLRMKLVSMGLEPVSVRGFRTHLSMLAANGNSMQRWWFTPLFDAFETTDDRTSFHIKGQRAQLMAQEEISNNQGQRTDAPFTRVSTEKYARQFTEKFPELCEDVPAFADLQNLIDLAVLAALLEKERLPERVNWKMERFLDESVPISRGNVPKQVPTSFNYRMAGSRMVIGLLGGGVTINARQIVNEVSYDNTNSARLQGIQQGAVQNRKPAAENWWWD